MSEAVTNLDNRKLIDQIKELGPWHMPIAINDEVDTGKVFDGISRKQNHNVGLPQLYPHFMKQLDELFPGGLKGKRFLDCACNSGGYCFWVNEREVDYAFGFDVRDHWINQAKFIQQHRTLAPTDTIDFVVADLLDLASYKLEPFDFTMFKGIFYHLPDPIASLKLVADLTSDVMILNTATTVGETDGYMKCKIEGDHLMSGVHALSWLPTGPIVMKKILQYCGFKDFRLRFFRSNPNDGTVGRLEIVAAKTEGRLEGTSGNKIAMTT